MNFLQDLVNELSVESSNTTDEQYNELLTYAIESGSSDLNRTLSMMSALEDNFHHHFSSGDESFENYQAYRQSVAVIFTTTGIDIPVELIVPSFESLTYNSYSTEAEEKKDGLLKRAWQAFVAMLKRVRDWITGADSKGKVVKLELELAATKAKAKDINDKADKVLAEADKILPTSTDTAKTNTPAPANSKSTSVTVALIEALNLETLLKDLNAATSAITRGVRLLSLNEKTLNGLTKATLTTERERLKEYLFDYKDVYKKKRKVTTVKPVMVLDTIASWDIMFYPGFKNTLINLDKDLDVILRNSSKEWEKLAKDDGRLRGGRDTQGHVATAKLKLDIVFMVVKDIKNRLDCLEALNKNMMQIVTIIEHKFNNNA